MGAADFEFGWTWRERGVLKCIEGMKQVTDGIWREDSSGYHEENGG